MTLADLQGVLEHPTFLRLRNLVWDYPGPDRSPTIFQLSMRDPQGQEWLRIGSLTEVIRLAYAELPLCPPPEEDR